MHDNSVKDDEGMEVKDKKKTTVASDGQYEMTDANTPLYDASEEMVKAAALVRGAKDTLDKAENVWIEEMKKVNKSTINHKGDIIELVRGKTTDDHARFKKS